MELMNHLFQSNQRSIYFEDEIYSKKTDTFVGTMFTENVEEYEQLQTFFDENQQKMARMILSAGLEAQHERLGNVLELGCGTGYYSAAFLSLDQKFERFLINDISNQMLKKCRRNLIENGKSLDRVSFFMGDISESHFVDGAFSFIFGSSILHHILDVELFLAEIKRVLAPGGVFLVREPIATSYQHVVATIKLMIQLGDAQWRPFSKREKQKLDVYCQNIINRSFGYFDRQALAQLDDKHLFWEKGLITVAKNLGFSKVDFLGSREIKKDTSIIPQGQGSCKNLLIEILDALGIRHRPSLEAVANIYDTNFPSMYTDELALQKIIRLTK